MAKGEVIFEDYTIKVQNTIDDKINAVLEECAGELESQVKRNSRVDTGKTKNSFQHKVVDSEHTAYIGSNDENAIWEEFGKKFLCRIKIGQNRLNFMGKYGTIYP